MRDPRLLDWDSGEVVSTSGGRSRYRPLPSPRVIRLPNRVPVTTYVAPWWARLDRATVASWAVVAFAAVYLLVHLVAWVRRGLP